MVKRYASIDFLRGFAIWMMVFVHSLQRWVDIDGISARLDQLPMFIFILLIAAIFFGGWAGFFLMVSATGNMVSMHNAMKRSGKPGSVIQKQIIGGVLLLIFAVATEAWTGYHGGLGGLVIGDSADSIIHTMLYRGFHMETIHAIAWCIILNGLVQWVLSVKEGYKKIKRNIIIYMVLAVVVILVSIPVWEGLRFAFSGLDEFALPLEYPYGVPLAGIERIQYGIIGQTPFLRMIGQFFLAPLAGDPEPVFPFLAVSFIGSIIGLFLCKKQEEREENPDKLPSTRPLTKGMIIGFVMFLIGLVIVVLLAVLSNLTLVDGQLIGEFGQEINVGLIPHHYSIRRLYEDGLLYGSLVKGLGFWQNPYIFFWVGWFFVATGAQLGCTTLIIRAVEFRGKAKQFGRKTKYFRRFGAVAFSIYNYQFLDVFVVLLFAAIGYFIPALGIPGSTQIPLGYTATIGFGGARSAYGPIRIWFLIGGIYLMWQLVLLLWEKANFTLGLEWMIAKIAGIFVPSLRKKEGFFYSSRLDAKKIIHAPEWIEIIPYDKVQHKDLVDSKFAARLGIMGILIAPLSLVSVGVSMSALKTEGKNKYSKRALRRAIFSVSFYVVVIILIFIFKGIAL